MKRHASKAYRFAFYGLSASGKSCYLGMLRLNQSGEGGFTSEYLPVDVPKPATQPDTHAEQETLGRDKPVAEPIPAASKNPLTHAKQQALGLLKSCAALILGAFSTTRAKQQALGGRKLVDESTATTPLTHEQEALGLHKGKEWLDKIVRNLENGELPEANPASYSPPPPILDFRVGHPSRGCANVRLVDYSGELINPAEEYDPQSSVRKLREFLAQSDGFLIFAEVPRRDGTARAHLGLGPLREAFASLQRSKKDSITTPVCVVLTKWDRYSDIERSSPDAELQKLTRFLSESPDHEGLIAAVANALAQQAAAPVENPTTASTPPPVQAGSSSHDALATTRTPHGADGPNDESNVGLADVPPRDAHDYASSAYTSPSPVAPGETANGSCALERGNTCIFPVSSFGGARLEGDRELPPTRLRPFNLVQPLLWLADCRDRLDLADLEQRTQSVRWASLPFAFVARRVRNLHSDLAKVRQRVPSHLPYARRLAELRQRVLKRLVISLATTGLLLLFVLAGGMSLLRNYQFRTHVRKGADPTLTREEMDRLILFFTSYISYGFWNGPFAPGADEAQQVLERLYTERDELHWRPVQSAPDLKAKASAAAEYLKQLPRGKHAPQARGLVREWEAEKARREGERKNRQWLQQLANQLAASRSAEEIDALLKKLAEPFPAQDYVTPELTKERDKLEKEATARREKLVWERWVANYRQQLSDGDLPRAAKVLLASDIPRDVQWRNIVKEFPADAANHLQNKIPSQLDLVEFSNARKSLRACLDALKHLESALRPADAELAEIMCRAQQDVSNRWSKQIDEREDRYLYGLVQRYHDKASCENYLHQAPVGRRRADVQAYLDYLQGLEKELQCLVQLRIRWDASYAPDDFGKGENKITVTVNNRVVGQTREEVAEDPGNTSGPVLTFPLKGKPDEAFDIGVKIVERDVLSSDDDGGSGEKRCTLKALAQEERIPLRPEDGGFSNLALLRIVQGWPSEPRLPDWDEE